MNTSELLILGVEEMADLAGDKVISSFIMLDVSEMDISRAGGRLLMFHIEGFVVGRAPVATTAWIFAFT